MSEGQDTCALSVCVALTMSTGHINGSPKCYAVTHCTGHVLVGIYKSCALVKWVWL